METSTDINARAWTFDELVREGISLIPALAPQWTNHNPSDPGITLVELLAYFSEILAYRALRVTPDAKLNFLRLLHGGASPSSDALIGAPSADIDEAIRECVQVLSQHQCAVTASDFERFAVEAGADYLGAHGMLSARCVPSTDIRRALSAGNPVVTGHPSDVSVVLAPEPELPQDELDRLCWQVQGMLAPRCLLTTRVHVVGPSYLQLFVGCRIAPRPSVSFADAVEAADESLRRHFGPARPDEAIADATRLGCPVHLSTIAAAIDRTVGIDYVEDLSVRRIAVPDAIGFDDSLVGIRVGVVSRLGVDTVLGGLASASMRRLHTDDTGEAQTVLLYPWEMVRVQLSRDAVQEIGDGGYDVG